VDGPNKSNRHFWERSGTDDCDLVIDDDENNFRIDFRWIGYDDLVCNFGTYKVNPVTNGIFSLVCGILWTIGWAGILIYESISNGGVTVTLIAILFGTISLGIYLIYGSLAFLLNHTEISIEGGVLKIRSYPLPFRWKKLIKCSMINEIDYSMSYKKGKHNTEWPYSEIRAYDMNGRIIVLVKIAGERPFFEMLANIIQRRVVRTRLKNAGLVKDMA
jgi:hypothetical protein